MIYFYSGTPGSGKSLHVAQDIYSYIRRGKTVISNFDINYDAIRSRKKGYFFYRDNSELTPAWLIDFAVLAHKRNDYGTIIEKQTLLVIDECQLIFNCRSWNDKQRLAWCSFFVSIENMAIALFLLASLTVLLTVRFVL